MATTGSPGRRSRTCAGEASAKREELRETGERPGLAPGREDGADRDVVDRGARNAQAPVIGSSRARSSCASSWVERADAESGVEPASQGGRHVVLAPSGWDAVTHRARIARSTRSFAKTRTPAPRATATRATQCVASVAAESLRSSRSCTAAGRVRDHGLAETNRIETARRECLDVDDGIEPEHPPHLSAPRPAKEWRDVFTRPFRRNLRRRQRQIVRPLVNRECSADVDGFRARVSRMRRSSPRPSVERRARRLPRARPLRGARFSIASDARRSARFTEPSTTATLRGPSAGRGGSPQGPARACRDAERDSGARRLRPSASAGTDGDRAGAEPRPSSCRRSPWSARRREAPGGRAPSAAGSALARRAVGRGLWTMRIDNEETRIRRAFQGSTSGPSTSRSTRATASAKKTYKCVISRPRSGRPGFPDRRALTPRAGRVVRRVVRSAPCSASARTLRPSRAATWSARTSAGRRRAGQGKKFGPHAVDPTNDPALFASVSALEAPTGVLSFESDAWALRGPKTQWMAPNAPPPPVPPALVVNRRSSASTTSTNYTSARRDADRRRVAWNRRRWDQPVNIVFHPEPPPKENEAQGRGGSTAATSSTRTLRGSISSSATSRRGPRAQAGSR